MAANYVEEPAGFFPPYIEKTVVYPELNSQGNDSNTKKKSNPKLLFEEIFSSLGRFILTKVI